MLSDLGSVTHVLNGKFTKYSCQIRSRFTGAENKRRRVIPDCHLYKRQFDGRNPSDRTAFGLVLTTRTFRVDPRRKNCGQYTMPLKRGHVYGIRTSLPEFVNVCLGISLPTGQLVSSAIRPCVIVSSAQRGTYQIALLATYGNVPQAQITDPAIQHFSVPVSELQPRLGLAPVDHNRPAAPSEHRVQHQYVLALLGNVPPSHLFEWTDSETRTSVHFSESAMRRLEAIAAQRMQMWSQMQVAYNSSSEQTPLPATTYYSLAEPSVSLVMASDAMDVLIDLTLSVYQQVWRSYFFLQVCTSSLQEPKANQSRAPWP
jgi:hypothetical protein